MFRKIKNRVLFFFSIFTFISLLIVVLNLYQIKTTNEIITYNQKLDSIHVNILNQFGCFDDFFSIELINSAYYSNQTSAFIHRRDSLNRALIQLAQSTLDQKLLSDEIEKEIKIMLSEMDSLERIFNQMQILINQRGFKDFGKEGEMRDIIHQTEKMKSANMITILSLRRNEKDYIIRNDARYVKALNQIANQYLIEIKRQKGHSNQEKDSLYNYISNYRDIFNQLVELDMQLGLKDFSGLHFQFKQTEDKILAHFIELKNNVIQNSKKRLRDYLFTYLLLSALILSIAIFLSYFISRKITRRIRLLSLYIRDFINSGFKINEPLAVKQIDDEVGTLITNFDILKKNLMRHIDNLENLVQERTLQLKKQNNDIISSINYAKTIQEALLPDKDEFEKYFPESLIYYKPRSIVSGDFYWFKQFNDKNISVIAVADCTGHGVPGAMMSMLGMAFLNEIVSRESIKSAGDVLNALREMILIHFNSHQKAIITDGMDISVLVFFHSENTVQFAGAKRDLLFFRNGDRTIFKGDNQTIGAYYHKNRNFTNYQFELKNDDVFYLLTDGFQDQFGASSKRTLQRARAYDFFNEIVQLEFKSQLHILDNYLAYWQKDEPQTDDILILGFKYSRHNFYSSSISPQKEIFPDNSLANQFS